MSAPLVWINGRTVPPGEATVSLFDAGLQHGVGLFETMLARGGRVFRPDRHVARLIRSALELGLTDRLREDPLVEAVDQALAESGLEDARLRLTVTGGDLNLLTSRGEAPHDPTLAVQVQPPTVYPDTFFTEGVRTTIADARANPLDPSAGHKTLNYWMRIRMLQDAAMKRAGEALWFQVTNHLAGGSVSNAFVVKSGALLTPIARGEEDRGALPSPVLPGITRECVIECAEARGLPVHRKMLDIEDVTTADEVFLTNSSWGVLPVTGVEAETIRDGVPGPITLDLRRDWLERVRLECGGG